VSNAIESDERHNADDYTGKHNWNEHAPKKLFRLIWLAAHAFILTAFGSAVMNVRYT
jgi:hypothetical protein